jgi:acetylglutamate kinase
MPAPTPIYIIKIGGQVIDDKDALSGFLHSFAKTQGNKILVHGGGKLATQMAAQLNIPQQMVNGRRITDADTLKLVTMVYAGGINKSIVAQLQSNNCDAIGCCGADGNIILAKKRTGADIDYGFAGDIVSVQSEKLGRWLQEGYTPVIAPITHDGNGQLLNTNADTLAQEIAVALSAHHPATLIYCFEKKGVLQKADDDDSVIPHINPASFETLKNNGIISGGMIPKLENALKAVSRGIEQVLIGQASEFHALINHKSGTRITHDT